MKTIAISFISFCILTLVIVLLIPKTSELTETSTETSLLERETDASSKLISETKVSSDHREITIDETIDQKMKFILTNADVSSDRYLLLVKLLGTHESKVLAYLAQLRYSENMAIEGSDYAAVEMISRAMLEFYAQKPLANNLEKIEQLRETGPLFSNIVSDLFLAGSGPESAQVAYDWVMQNPEHPASLRSGATIGTIMNTYTPDEAWSQAITLPEGTIRERAFTAIITESTDGDINKAIDLINSVDATSDLDPAISNVLGMGIESGYPYSELVDIAAAPADPVYRSSSLVLLFQNWAMTDPESLHEWSLQKHAFSPEQMAEINLVVKQTLQRHLVQ